MGPKVISTEIPGVCAILPAEFKDGRGSFSEVYKRRIFEQAGVPGEFVQDNQSFSGQRGTVRGLHFQSPPEAQAKLVRVLTGAVLDVAVDIRAGSPTFGRHVSRVLSAANREQLFVPEGFAHGFCTLTDDVTVLYKVTRYYSPAHEMGVRWDDPELGIDWGISAAQALVAPRDLEFPELAQISKVFTYRG